MSTVVGIFRRKNKHETWCRLKAVGTKREMYSFHDMYPNHEIAMFSYEQLGCRDFTDKAYRTMKRVYD